MVSGFSGGGAGGGGGGKACKSIFTIIARSLIGWRRHIDLDTET